MPRVRVMRLLGTLHDMVCAAAVVPIAFVVRTGELPEWTTAVLVFQGALLVGAAISFHLFGLNQGSWRYASLDDLLGIIQSAIMAMLIAVIVTFVTSRLETIPRLVPIIGVVTLIVILSAPRLLYRLIKDRYIQRMFKSAKGGEPILIVGYCDEASALMRHLERQKKPTYHVAGIIDHTGRHVGRRLHTARVLGTLDDLQGLVRAFRASGTPIAKIVVGPSKVDRAVMESILDLCSELGVPVFSLPKKAQLMVSNDSAAIKPVAIQLEDLLGRPHADIDLQPVAAMLSGKTILVTGGGGSIGSELVGQILAYHPGRLVVVDNSEHNLYAIDQTVRSRSPDQSFAAVIADVRERETIRAIMKAHRPDLVFHAAALKHVPLVEHNIVEGAKTNILGTINVADTAVEAGATAFVMVSTDKAVNPTNVMGASKRFAEAYCQMLDRNPDYRTKFMTVRFGNVLGSAGSVVPLFTRQIAAGGPVTVTHRDMRRYFMSMQEAVTLVLAASAKGLSRPTERGKIMVLEMGTQIRIVDLANRMIQLAGLRPGIDIDIHFVGLRPGEKLFEERLQANEHIEATDDNWLLMAHPRAVEPGLLAGALARLKDAIDARDEARVLLAIRSVVPELSTQQPAVTDEVEARTATAAPAIDIADVRGRLRK
ncbi:MAG: nucleoside-diphosphate sugar epimerase/dehydratase [Hyphomicrobiales bacterium]|nr:nucleoside-diphosphate sugar epimerase/dehydratase [Hyphomicrobiales bacterium]